MSSFVLSLFSSCGDHVPSALEKYSNLRAKDTEAIVKMSERLDGGFFSFVFPLIVDSILNKIAPFIFSPNTIRSLQNYEKTFSQIKRRWGFILFCFILCFLCYVLFRFVLFSLKLCSRNYVCIQMSVMISHNESVPSFFRRIFSSFFFTVFTSKFIYLYFFLCHL